MGYLDDHLLDGERIVYRARLHWTIFLRSILALLLGIALGVVLYVYQPDYWWAGRDTGRHRTAARHPAAHPLQQHGIRGHQQATAEQGGICGAGVGSRRCSARSKQWPWIRASSAGCWDTAPLPSPVPAERTKAFPGYRTRWNSAARSRVRSWPRRSGGARRPRRRQPVRPTARRVERECPYCAEKILARARVCKHCGRDVVPVSG